MIYHRRGMIYFILTYLTLRYVTVTLITLMVPYNKMLR